MLGQYWTQGIGCIWTKEFSWNLYANPLLLNSNAVEIISVSVPSATAKEAPIIRAVSISNII